MSLWITPEGLDYLTSKIDKGGQWTYKALREEDILDILEYMGGGYSKDQILDSLEGRNLPESLWGMSRKQYERTLDNLVSRGYIADLGVA